jgi:hypothetical protein
MQFGPVGVECPGVELAHEGLDFSQRAGPLVAGFCRRGEGRRTDGCHDTPAFFRFTACAALGALCGAVAQFWTDLLKEGFNCPDPADMVSTP